jgi:hypothetical protein
MYCSEKCHDSDWSAGHKKSCTLNEDYFSAENKFPVMCMVGGTAAQAGNANYATLSITLQHRLISFLDPNVIRDTVMNNKDLDSFADNRTKGFRHGKFGYPCLESVLSLEDNIDKISDLERSMQAHVRLIVTKFSNLLWLIKFNSSWPLTLHPPIKCKTGN